MASKRIGSAKRYIVANTASILTLVILAVVSTVEIISEHGVTATEGVLIAVIPTALLLLIFVFKATRDFSRLAFFVPIVLFALASFILTANTQHVYFFYLLVCFFICGISCLYTNFFQTLAYTLVQALVAGVLFFVDIYNVVEHGASLGILIGIFGLFLFCCFFLIIVTKTATVDLRKVSTEASYFRTYLSATKNYLAMLDNSNRIVYVSKPMSEMAQIENPELTKGRPFIDLFPSRELRLLANRMLGRRDLYESNWEFNLYRQKRYFKAISSGMVGETRGGTLITMLDMTHLAERDEIAAMKDSLKIGIFFMDQDYIIQDNYSRYLEELLADGDLKGKQFTDLLKASVSARELDSIKDYLGMVVDRTFDHVTLSEINPLHELCYVDPQGNKKIFNCAFLTVDRGKDEVAVLVTIYDITAQTELQERLQREERKRQEEMSSLFELIQVDSATFKAFQEDVEYEFSRIDDILGDSSLANQEILVEVYQSVHAIKSNAVTLGLNNFGVKVHEVESEIKRLRNQETEIPFDDMLHLTIEIEKLVQEKESFKQIINRIKSFKAESGEQKSHEDLLLETLSKTADKVAADTEKKIRFVTTDVDLDAIEKGPRQVMKEVLMQLVRNSVMHGLETPDERLSRGKNEVGTIRLSIKHSDSNIHVRLGDDGRGIDFDKIREKAVSMNLIKEEEASNKNQLLKAIFSAGFSTAEDEEGMHAGRGIGLNLVRDRVRNARGTIKLQTESGKGTVFNIFFPVENAEAMNKAS